MIVYVIRRLFSGVVMVLLVTLATFFFFFTAGTNPAQQTCGKNCSPALIEQNKKALGYDKPVLEQWGEFAIGTVAGREYPLDKKLREDNPQMAVSCNFPCLGYSPLQAQLVWDEIKSAVPVSASLAVMAMILTLVLGVGLGIVAALNAGGIIDKLCVALAIGAYSLPTFATGLLFLQFVCLKWNILPLPQYQTIADGGIGGWLQGLFVPSLTLALFTAGSYVRMTRAFVLETMSEDYLRTAKAKGLNKRTILWKHTMRAAVTPVMTMAGIDFAVLLGGAIIAEYVFGYHGMGYLAVISTENAPDLPTTIGIVVVLSLFVILANIIVDCLYAVVDPRVKLA